MLSGYYIVSEYSGKVLDDPGGSTSQNTFIDQWQLTGTANQQWNFTYEGNGYYAITNAKSGMALTDYDNQTGDGRKGRPVAVLRRPAAAMTPGGGGERERQRRVLQHVYRPSAWATGGSRTVTRPG